MSARAEVLRALKNLRVKGYIRHYYGRYASKRAGQMAFKGLKKPQSSKVGVEAYVRLDRSKAEKLQSYFRKRKGLYGGAGLIAGSFLASYYGSHAGYDKYRKRVKRTQRRY